MHSLESIREFTELVITYEVSRLGALGSVLGVKFPVTVSIRIADLIDATKCQGGLINHLKVYLREVCSPALASFAMISLGNAPVVKWCSIELFPAVFQNTVFGSIWIINSCNFIELAKIPSSRDSQRKTPKGSCSFNARTRTFLQMIC